MCMVERQRMWMEILRVLRGSEVERRKSKEGCRKGD
jgi:hypothetical protein